MRDSYVNNIQEILSANESQKNKIEFLERERIKRDHYLSDLQQNLHLNKQTLQEYNALGSNDASFSRLLQEATMLGEKIKQYYDEYQNINAILLMEKQMRLQDKQFFQERVIQFENKIIDLRKYLHDKEDSFSSVVLRLKMYEDLGEPTMEDKLYNFKKEIGERSTNEFITELVKERNFYKSEFQKQKKHILTFNEMKYAIISRFPQVETMLEEYQSTHNIRLTMLIGNLYHQVEDEKDKKSAKKIEPNKELIRLLKKEKLNNQILEEALNEALEKNEELVTIKDILEKNISKLQNKCKLAHAEGTVFALRLAEYDQHYGRCLTHHRNYYEEGQKQGLDHITQKRLKEYAGAASRFYQTNVHLHQKFSEKLKQDVDRWSQFICEAHQIKKSMNKQSILVKSCSVPTLIVGFELEQDYDQLIIEEF